MSLIENNDATQTSYDNVDSTSEFDSTYWSELSDTQHFYYAGFMLGDAYVKSSDNTIGVDLAIKDYEWLINYKKNLHIDNKISIRDCRPRKNSVTASVRKKDKQWVKDLAKYSIKPRKTGHESLPVDYCTTPEEYSALILGIFDADASIYKETKSQRYRASFYGTATVCSQINKVLEEYAGIEPNKMTISNRKCDFIWSTSHGAKEDLVKLYDFMYMNKELEDSYLSRKYSRWSRFMATTRDVN